MESLQIQIRPRHTQADSEQGVDTSVPEEVAQPEAVAADRAPAAPATDLRVRIGNQSDEVGGKLDAIVLGSVMTVAIITAVIAGLANPVILGLALSVAGGCGGHLLLGRPVFKLARSLAAEGQRLRAAMTCPYCRDHLPDDAAIVCDRTGCGTFYHEECWEECRHTYGGCAIYGCGSADGHLVGRFALQRRVIRLLIAAAIFPPKLVKRLRESERLSFGDVWRRSRALQDRISNDLGSTMLVGMGNFLVSLLVLAGLLAVATPPDRSDVTATVMLVLLLVLPVVLMRFPLLSHFTWFASKLLGRVFRDELAALSRADEGTFLARLSSYTGKSD